jgi:hypothetical protein
MPTPAVFEILILDPFLWLNLTPLIALPRVKEK